MFCTKDPGIKLTGFNDRSQNKRSYSCTTNHGYGDAGHERLGQRKNDLVRPATTQRRNLFFASRIWYKRTGKEVKYIKWREMTGRWHTSSADGQNICGDGEGSLVVAKAKDGQWINYLLWKEISFNLEIGEHETSPIQIGTHVHFSPMADHPGNRKLKYACREIKNNRWNSFYHTCIICCFFSHAQTKGNDVITSTSSLPQPA